MGDLRLTYNNTKGDDHSLQARKDTVVEIKDVVDCGNNAIKIVEGEKEYQKRCIYCENTRATTRPRDYMSTILYRLKFLGAAILTLVIQSLLFLKNISDPVRYVLATSVCFLSLFTFSSLMTKYLMRGEVSRHNDCAIEIAEAVFIGWHFIVSIINVVSIPRSMTFALGSGIAMACVIVVIAFIDCLAWLFKFTAEYNSNSCQIKEVIR